MISVLEARELMEGRARARWLGTELVGLVELPGRLLAEDLFSSEPSPAWDNSAMDGFAVCAHETALATPECPVHLRVTASLAAGDSAGMLPGDQDLALTAVEIMTGAPMPPGRWDSVIKVEDVELRPGPGGGGEILIRRPVDKGANVRLRGEDFDVGAPVASSGTKVTPDLLMAMASLGLTRARVRCRPRVAVISTGRELVPASTETLAPGMIRNSTGPYLMAALSRLGCEARWWGTIADRPDDFVQLLDQVLAERPDVILTTGAVSMGKFDFVREALESMGARTVFHKVAIRPGKPLLFAEFAAGPVVFGVPGNPISTAVGLRFFVEPYLRALKGLEPERPIRARLHRSVKKPDGLRCYFKAEVAVDEAGVRVEALSGQGSALIGPLVRANAWVELPEDGALAAAGNWVNVHPFFPMEKSWAAPSLQAARDQGLETTREARSSRELAVTEEERCCR